MKPRTLNLTVTTGEPRQTWCDDCNLSTRTEVDVYLIAPTAVSTLGTIRRCERCGTQGEPQPTG